MRRPGTEIRLSDATLASLPEGVALPGYDRSAVRTGIVHLGIGAFHRAHQAVVFDDALRGGDLRWGILGASLRSPGVRDQLNPQDGLYTLVVRDGSGDTLRVIGAGRGVVVAPEDPDALVEAMAQADVHIVTLTVTEKGYRLDPATGVLKLDDPDVVADIADLSQPRTAPGFIVAALRARRASGLGPFTVISCDNLPHNGKRIRAGVIELARQVEPDLADWIEAECAFPQTMIDRIVPATTPDDITGLEARLSVRDEGMVKAEPFTQWVIEDQFCSERPDFAALGVQLTKAVEPWEDAKLRLLNGAHSSIAYLGALSGHEYVHLAMATPALKAFVATLWDEAQTTLSPPPGLDLADYRLQLMARFENPALMHRTRQIAMDGSQKLPQRLLAGAAERLGAGQSIDAMALGIAGWMRWQSGRTESGETFVVDDPLADETAELLKSAQDDEARVMALLSLRAVFPEPLSTHPAFVTALIAAYQSLGELGAVEAARKVVGQVA